VTDRLVIDLDYGQVPYEATLDNLGTVPVLAAVYLPPAPGRLPAFAIVVPMESKTPERGAYSAGTFAVLDRVMDDDAGEIRHTGGVYDLTWSDATAEIIRRIGRG
jgi:hypothetical protein